MTIFNYYINYVDIIIVAIIILLTIDGARRGIVLTIINFFRFILGTGLCYFVSNNVSLPIYNAFVKPKIMEWAGNTINSELEPLKFQEILNNLPDGIPDFIISSLNLNSDDINKIFSEGNPANALVDLYLDPVMIIFVKAILFLITFVLFFAVTGIIIFAVKKHNSGKRKANGESTIKTIDRIIGSLFGLCKGVILVFVFVNIVNIFICDLNMQANSFLTSASESYLFNEIVRFNPLDFIMEVSK